MEISLGPRDRPVALGVKVTLTVQLAPGDRLDPHVLALCWNSVALVPVIAIPVMPTAELAVLVMVSVSALLAVAVNCGVNARLAGEKESVPGPSVMETAYCCVP
jgi:hypothetical protein